MDENIVTCTAPVNIATIKYWGKRREDLILPLNSSLSVTLDQEDLKATTSIALSPQFTQNRIWLNSREESFDNQRLINCIQEVQLRANREEPAIGSNNRGQQCLHICSKNNFPTAAGLASSAAGYACLVKALTVLYGLDGETSDIARLGSGSACRSMYGGFVEWVMGTKPDGSDSIARQVAPETHWPQLKILILVVRDEKKPVGSSEGMKTSVLTSDLLKHRANNIVPDRMTEMTKAILNKDFSKFAQITMKDSNQLHAICMDTYPPLFYLNETSKKIIHFVNEFNRKHQETKLAYTFDAGPNAVLFVLEENILDVLALLMKYFPPNKPKEFIKSKYFDLKLVEKKLNDLPLEAMLDLQTSECAIKYIIHTGVGKGPQVLSSSDVHLLQINGDPK